MNNSRYELKYEISFNQYIYFKKLISAHTFKDKYSKLGNNEKYLVRSLYYENPNFLCLKDKLEGEYQRIKVRIRSYSHNKEDNEFVSIELKKRFGDLIIKDSYRATVVDYLFYLKNKFWNLDDQVINEFQRINFKYCFKPALIIEYRREVYECKNNNNIRIAFDHDIKSSKNTDLFNNVNEFQYPNSNYIVLEIKTPNEIPNWLKSAIKQASLERVSHSKYVQGIINLNLFNFGNLSSYSNNNI